MKQYAMQWLIGGGAALGLSYIARALPEPLPMGNRFYLFVFNLSHIMAANPDKVQHTEAK